MSVNSVYTTCIMLSVMAGFWVGDLDIAGGFDLQGTLWVGATPGVPALLTLLLEPRFARAPVGGALGR